MVPATARRGVSLKLEKCYFWPDFLTQFTLSARRNHSHTTA
ncbi:hypothetical protein FB548_3141 [Pseudoxanthomonas sp. 3HH-4]|nr:hypothetical protein FB548_3141 [Pseudoxanthomonas sp. 3HH-4]